MPTLFDLKTIVANYHQKNVADLLINGIDMFLNTANEVRHNAELLHDFEFSRCRATLAIDGVSGGDLDDAIIFDPPSQILISGDSEDMINGLYTQLPMFNGYWAYTTDGNFYVYWNSAYSSYVVSDGLVDGPRTYVWIPSVPRTLPEGDYLLQTPPTPTAATAVRQNEFDTIKEIVAIQRASRSGRIVPVDFTSPDVAIERDRAVYEVRDDMWPIERYPSDAQILSRTSQTTIVQRRRTLSIYPPCVSATSSSSPPVLVQLECLGFLNDWEPTDMTSGAPELNWFGEHGYNWLKWKMIYELNPLFSTFVARQEGNVGNDPKAILQYIAAAWEQFTLWDSYQIAANATRSR